MRRSTMSNESLDLSILSDFVSEILSSTEATKRILEIECNEARYILRACPVEMIVTKEIDEACCTCERKTLFENHAKEIVDGIGRALAQAQELREKIAINMARENRRARQPNVETIYAPSDKQVSKKSQTLDGQKRSTKPRKLDIESKQPTGVSSSESQITKSPLEEQKSLVQPNKKCEPNPKLKTIADKKLLRLSAGNTMNTENIRKVKLTKNFIAANKSNLKSLKRNSKSTVDLTRGLAISSAKSRQSMDLSPLSGTSQTLSGCSTSIAKLNNLMDKVSLGSRKSSSTSCLEFDNPDCPYHCAYSEGVVQQRVHDTIDLMEGLDRFGIPADIVRLLKIYHSYATKELLEVEIVDKKGQRARNKFLAQFEKMNEDRKTKKDMNYPTVAALTTDFASLFRDLYVRSSNATSVAMERSSRYTELDRRGKICHLQKFDPTKFRKTKNGKVCVDNNEIGTSGWSSNGVWNRTHRDSFPATMDTRCIRYANKSQLLLFFKLDQRLQLLLYHRDLMDLLMDKVIPNVLEKFDRNGTEYSESYKMLFTIAQVLNPCTSVLVQADA